MQWFKQIFNFYLDASIHVALAVASLYFVSVEILKVSTNWSLAGFLFFGTIVCYNFIKFGVEAEKYLIVRNPYHKIIQGFSFLSFAFALYLFFRLELKIWIAILILMGIAVLYAIPLLPKAKNLRNFAGLKTFLVALVWTGCTISLPVIDNQLEITWDIKVIGFQRFLLVLILLLPFEIRDMKYDSPELKTMPQRIGVERTKVVGYVLTLLYFLSSFMKDELNITEILIKMSVTLLLIVVLKGTKENQKLYFSSFWVELIPILYLGAVLLLNVLL
jgi:multisubunit Na+/H+ antiporter MnhC subunit